MEEIFRPEAAGHSRGLTSNPGTQHMSLSAGIVRQAMGMAGLWHAWDSKDCSLGQRLAGDLSRERLGAIEL